MSVTEVAIRVENLSKRYHIGALQQRHDTLKDALASTFQRSNARTLERPDEIWALRDVSFEVNRGEVVGIIGRNGAGKSTLLKILSRITEPTEGRAEIYGRVGSLLEVGTGFHPELTGRENIYLNGAILGMRRGEIDRRFDEIVAFAEIEQFLDTPVKRYSSGMYVRLAFAVAAHLEPEILLVDEVLAVGDAAFQNKCLGKMGEVARGGRTVIFVSHNMGAVLALCSRSVHLANGGILGLGPTRQVIAEYLSRSFRQTGRELEDLRAPGWGSSMRFTEVRLLSSGTSKVHFGEPLVYHMRVESKIAADGLSIGSSIFNSSGFVVGSLVTHDQFSMAAGEALSLELTIRSLTLAPGIYYTGFSIGTGGLNTQRQEYDIVVGTYLSFEILAPVGGSLSLAGWSPGWGDVVFQDSQLRVLRTAG